ncbi:N-acetyltransferase family protein [Macrococcus brunensis]|uniref:N-acetyltransferase family protein n=1 Tax=Macrococcus brunensis TaxID=198483 RepID=A0A4R6BEG4_9STAP|nr:GNAT family N-acetyltransferase [Macrococcus brunensis]TDL98172.1 N-acetyltransferase family protein [Macrococcus brunensis]
MKARQAELKDLDKIVEIYNSTIASRMVTADIEPVTVNSRLDWFHAHHDGKPLLVIEHENNLVGWMSFSTFYARPAYNQTVEISIYIDENYRGQGIGRYALDELKRQAAELDYKTLLAFIFSHNTPSIRLFEKNGFTTYGQLPDVAWMDDKAYSLTILGYQINLYS